MANHVARGKWCIVEHCRNTSVSAPNKIFVSVPKWRRNAWLEAAGRDPQRLSRNTTLYCCEDHFDLPNDVENWIRYTMTKCKIHFKKHVVPHIFKSQPYLKRAAGATDLRVDTFKRLRTVVNTSLPVFTDHEIKPSSSRIDSCTITADQDADHTSYPSTSVYTRPTETLVMPDKPLLVSKSVQVKPKFRSKYVQCKIESQNVSTSPIKNIFVDSFTSPIKEFKNKSTKLT